MKNLILLFVLLEIAASAYVINPSEAAFNGCGQAVVETKVGGPAPPADWPNYIPAAGTILPAPFYQWESNNGYCGEVSMMSAGLANGQWMSQFHARAICGTISGLPGGGGSLLGQGCPSGTKVDYNAQMLLETPGTPQVGSNDFSNAARCLSNSRLNATTFPYQTGWNPGTGAVPNNGAAGYQNFMRWVKHEVMAGHKVTLGILWRYGTDTQYDHEVSVIKIGTNHLPITDAYYADDILYFEDHGLMTMQTPTKWDNNPAIPPGANNDHCTPYVFKYTFGTLGKTRANSYKNANAYSIVIPSTTTNVSTGTGGNGANITVQGPHNYGFSVWGPQDTGGVTKPVVVDIASTSTGSINPVDPVAGFRYENPYIGNSDTGTACTQDPPSSWMSVDLRATVSGLTPGTNYTLYEYDFTGVSGTGSAAALNLPTANFNTWVCNPALGPCPTRSSTPINISSGSTFTTPIITKNSNVIVIFRAVPNSAP